MILCQESWNLVWNTLWGKFCFVILLKTKQPYWNYYGLSLESREQYLALLLHNPNTTQRSTLQHYSANAFLPFSTMILSIFAFSTCVQTFLCTPYVIYWILRSFCDKKLVGIRWTFHRFHFHSWQLRETVVFSFTF